MIIETQMRNKQMSEILKLHEIAAAAASAAANKYFNESLGGQDWYPCGFAWVELNGIKMNTRDGKEFAKCGFERNYAGGPVSLWNPSKWNGQNVDAKYAGAIAYAKVFRDAGYTVFANSRLD
jgi:hypothetical protein